MKRRIRASVKQKSSTRLKAIVVVGAGMVAIGVIFLLVFGLNLTSKNAKANEDITSYWSLEQVTPEDFRSSVDVSIESKINCLLLVKLYSEKEELIAKEIVELKEGTNTHHLADLEMLPKGEYVVEVSGEDKSVTRKIYKKQLDSQYYINHLGLSPHPEGGFFKEVYRSSEQIENLPARYKSGARAFSTSIYFLLNGAQKSHFHRIQSDETWHFYAGSSLRLHQIDVTGQYQQVLIGSDLVNGQVLQYTVPKNVWFAAEVIDKEEFGLVGCTVAPGFDFADFELAKTSDLERICPEQTVLIKDFCLD